MSGGDEEDALAVCGELGEVGEELDSSRIAGSVSSGDWTMTTRVPTAGGSTNGSDIKDGTRQRRQVKEA